jgi:non-heme chloroperoxidase
LLLDQSGRSAAARMEPKFKGDVAGGLHTSEGFMSIILAADGTEIYFEDTGEGPPLVFVHGWPSSGAMWEYQVVPLVEAGFRCITLDRRGFGRSGKSGGGYDYKTMGADVASVIDHLGLEHATLIGFSMGGGEVIEVLTRHNTGRITKAMLVASIVPYLLKTSDNPDGVDGSVFDGVIAGLRKDRPGFLTDFSEKFFGVGLLASPVSMPMLASSVEMAMPASPIATLECVRAFSATDFRGMAKAVRLPVLIIYGDADAIVPIDVSGKSAAEMIPNAELKIYRNAPHGLFYTHRDELNRDIAAFASDGRVALATAA